MHQGVALQLPAYAYAHPDDLLADALAAETEPLIVALDGVMDPRNLGAIVRSAAAFGAHGVLIPERRAAGMTAAAWKTSAGAAARLPIARATNLNRALRGYADAGFALVGLDGQADVLIDQVVEASGPLVLVVGSEDTGLSRLVREACDTVAAIPISAGVESLNAGVAAGVALYEIGRRRRSTPSRFPTSSGRHRGSSSARWAATGGRGSRAASCSCGDWPSVAPKRGEAVRRRPRPSLTS